MRIAVATCDQLEDWYKDLDILINAIAATGAIVEPIVWDKPGIEWANFDIIFVDSIWDYVEKPDKFLQWCERVSPKSTLINSLEVIRLSGNKKYLFELEKAGLNIPESQLLKSRSPLGPLSYSGRIVVKPVIGSDGINTFLFENLPAMLNSSKFAKVHAKQDVIIQEYAPEIKSLGEIGAIFIAGKLSHAVLKTPGNHDFRVQPQYGGKISLVEPPSYTSRLYSEVISALGVEPLYMRLDFIPTPNPIIMEVEMIEPYKFFYLYPQGAKELAEALVKVKQKMF